MIKPQIYKGIEFVQLRALPQNQRMLIERTLNKSLLIKIMVDTEIHHDCLQYKDYVNWFEGIYVIENIPVPAKVSKVN